MATPVRKDIYRISISNFRLRQIKQLEALLDKNGESIVRKAFDDYYEKHLPMLIQAGIVTYNHQLKI